MQEQLDRILEIVGGTPTTLTDVGLLPLGFVLLVSLASAFFSAYLYLAFFSSRATGSQAYRAFPLVGVSVTALFICIQFSLPLSLGLLGALSIVRFRTPIKEPEEIGFIMLVIAAAIACATFNIALLGLLLGVAVFALLLQRRLKGMRSGSTEGLLVLTLPETAYRTHEPAMRDVMGRRLLRARLESVTRNDEGVIVAYNFHGVSDAAVHDLERELSAITSAGSVSILVNRPGMP